MHMQGRSPSMLNRTRGIFTTERRPLGGTLSVGCLNVNKESPTNKGTTTASPLLSNVDLYGVTWTHKSLGSSVSHKAKTGTERPKSTLTVLSNCGECRNIYGEGLHDPLLKISKIIETQKPLALRATLLMR